MTRIRPENTSFNIIPGTARSTMERAQGCTAKDLKEVLQGLALAAGGCMKAAPSKVERTRLRLALVRALKVMKAPMADYETPPPGGRTNPAEMITDYVNSGGDWQALIAAITTRGRSGQTKILFTPPAKGKNQCGTQWKN